MKRAFSHFNVQLQRQYVVLLLDIVARALVSASQVDRKIQQEIAQYPVGFRIGMNIFATDLGFYLETTAQHHWRILSTSERHDRPIDICISFKHIRYAFLVLSFQESTAQAFANDRMFVNGDLSSAVRFVRCLNQLESVILPKFIARLAVKEYPQSLKIAEKANLAQQIYRKVAKSYLKGK